VRKRKLLLHLTTGGYKTFRQVATLEVDALPDLYKLVEVDGRLYQVSQSDYETEANAHEVSIVARYYTEQQEGAGQLALGITETEEATV